MNNLIAQNKSLILKDGILFFILVLFASGCVKKPDEVWVNINLDWRAYTPSQQIGFIFYGTKGTHMREGNAAGFRGFIPPDTYQVVIYNTDMKNADVVLVGGYDEDLIVARPIETRNGDEFNKLDLVDQIYGTGVSRISSGVTSNTFSIEVQPVNYAKKVTFLIDTSNVPNVDKVHVRVDGIVKSRYITRDEIIEIESGYIIDLAAYADDLQRYRSFISALGYTHSSFLTIEIQYTNGLTETSDPIPLADYLSDFPEDSKVIDFRPKFPSGNTVNVTARIYGWNDGAPGWGVIE